MKDKLEDFIDKSRVDFDNIEPRSGLWDNIENQLENNLEVRRNSNYQWLISVAASVALILAVIWVFRDNPNVDEQIAVDVVGQEENAREELVEVERYYAGLIDQKKADIRLIVNNSKTMDSQILQDLDDLDQLYFDLKKDLNKSGNNDRVINAMIQNLQLRVEILNRQLMILEQISKYEEDENIAI